MLFQLLQLIRPQESLDHVHIALHEGERTARLLPDQADFGFVDMLPLPTAPELRKTLHEETRSLIELHQAIGPGTRLVLCQPWLGPVAVVLMRLDQRRS